MSDNKCAKCMWFLPKSNSGQGQCRRHAPTGESWPFVFKSDWCGDHRLNENKIDREEEMTKFTWMPRPPEALLPLMMPKSRMKVKGFNRV